MRGFFIVNLIENLVGSALIVNLIENLFVLFRLVTRKRNGAIDLLGNKLMSYLTAHCPFSKCLLPGNLCSKVGLDFPNESRDSTP